MRMFSALKTPRKTRKYRAPNSVVSQKSPCQSEDQQGQMLSISDAVGILAVIQRLLFSRILVLQRVLARHTCLLAIRSSLLQ